MVAGSVDPVDHPPRDFSAADWRWCRNAAERLGLILPDEERARWATLHGHLVGVNAWLNLTRVGDGRDWLKQHLLDSLSGLLVPVVARCQGLILDLGSGGGYPGLPLATRLPGCRWVLCDSRRRKVAFLSAAAGLVPEAEIEARAFRAREAPTAAVDLVGRVDLVVSRAAGSPADLAHECARLLRPGGHLVCWRGPRRDGEDPPRGWRRVDEVGLHLEPGDPERRLLVWRCA